VSSSPAPLVADAKMTGSSNSSRILYHQHHSTTSIMLLLTGTMTKTALVIS